VQSPGSFGWVISGGQFSAQYSNIEDGLPGIKTVYDWRFLGLKGKEPVSALVLLNACKAISPASGNKYHLNLL
jgi:hypothetical protein